MNIVRKENVFEAEDDGDILIMEIRPNGRVFLWSDEIFLSKDAAIEMLGAAIEWLRTQKGEPGHGG